MIGNLKKAIVVGAGISGATAAQRLKEEGYDVTVLEAQDRVGGKLFSDRSLGKNNKAIDLGAVVLAANYPIIDFIKETQIEVIKMPRSSEYSLNQVLYQTDNPSFTDKLTYGINLTAECFKFTKAVWDYNAYLSDYNNTTPPDEPLLFKDFLLKHELNNLARFLELLVPGMGYGSLDQNQTYKMINYLGYGTVPSLALGNAFFNQDVLSIKNGYQTVVEKMLDKIDVRLSADIIKIDRKNKDRVSVSYKHNKKNEIVKVEADLLVLTMSPYYWNDLNMELTEVETKCIGELKYYPYPIAVCDIEGIPENQVFVPSALQSNGFGHVGFISTKGEGRCVVYMNLNPMQKGFSLDEDSEGRKTLLEDLNKLGYPNVKILKTVVWEDYNPTLSLTTAAELEREQGNNHTLYLGSHCLGSFETVAANQQYAIDTIDRYCGKAPKPLLSAFSEHIRRGYDFFSTLPSSNVIDSELEPEKKTASKLNS